MSVELRAGGLLTARLITAATAATTTAATASAAEGQEAAELLFPKASYEPFHFHWSPPKGKPLGFRVCAGHLAEDKNFWGV